MEFSDISLGIDIATSVAVMVSAGTFLWNQKKQNELNKLQQLDGSVRAVAVEQLQEALHSLSNHFIVEVVGALQRPQGRTGGGLDEVEKRFFNIDGMSDDLLSEYERAGNAMADFMSMAHAHRYQIFPLLDALSNGQKEISEFKGALSELIDVLNGINQSAVPLARELEEVLSFCERHPSFAELNDEQRMELGQLAASIMNDPDYSHWVNSFIPDEEVDAYWSKGEENHDIKHKAFSLFIGHAYERPNRLRAQVFCRAYARYQEGQTMCKKFLVMLAAINYTLLCRPGSEAAKESPSETATRYAEEGYFALENEVR